MLCQTIPIAFAKHSSHWPTKKYYAVKPCTLSHCQFSLQVYADSKTKLYRLVDRLYLDAMSIRVFLIDGILLSPVTHFEAYTSQLAGLFWRLDSRMKRVNYISCDGFFNILYASLVL